MVKREKKVKDGEALVVVMVVVEVIEVVVELVEEEMMMC